MPFPKPKGRDKKKLKAGQVKTDSPLIVNYTTKQQQINQIKMEKTKEVEDEDYNFFSMFMIAAFVALTIASLFAPEFDDYQRDYIWFYCITIIVALWWIRSAARYAAPKYFKLSRDQRIWNKTNAELKTHEHFKNSMESEEHTTDMEFVFGARF